MNARINFTETAKSAVTLSDLMNGRDKIDTASIIRDYPDGVTLTAFDIISINGAQYPVFLIKENDAVYYNGGHVLNKIVERWIAAYDGNITDASDDLTECGGIKIKLKESKTKRGNNITNVEIVG